MTTIIATFIHLTLLFQKLISQEIYKEYNSTQVPKLQKCVEHMERSSLSRYFKNTPTFLSTLARQSPDMLLINENQKQFSSCFSIFSELQFCICILSNVASCNLDKKADTFIQMRT